LLTNLEPDFALVIHLLTSVSSIFLQHNYGIAILWTHRLSMFVLFISDLLNRKEIT